MTTARTPVPDAARRLPEAERRLSLRERKKLKTRTAIRDATYRLIKEQGYEATTVEQIAEEAEVSPSTVFRYFPTKEDIIITDEYDVLVEDLLRSRPADEPVLESVRWAIRRSMAMQVADTPDYVHEEMKLRTGLMVSVPAVRSRAMESMSVTGRLLCRAIADRTGRAPDDLEVRVYAMGLVSALLEAVLYWAERDYRDDVLNLVDRTLSTFRDLARRPPDDGPDHGPGVPPGEAPGAPEIHGPAAPQP
ncbi:TetR/AcrR family transcriptional regulator [Streptomyces acidicola]|uniref:TetR family transcriptional regulator n=1 Tax=Streptomyces acidicola TaxID=2596892 RepID=A0A5N8WSA8_9ACTN|nr:TetR/AcrR family transcriptional regulator [Streptomyces acidicola]MPY50300.1 TetR family transcriptional regulator [Streptomyces acidicola]